MNTIKKGDTVQILSGKDRNKRGKVLTSRPAADQVMVEGINIVKRHQKPKSAQKPGEIIDKMMPLRTSRVALVCPKCSKATRIGIKAEIGSQKVRICKKCQQPID